MLNSEVFSSDYLGPKPDPRVIGAKLVETILENSVGMMTSGNKVEVSMELIDEIDDYIRMHAQTIDPQEIIKNMKTETFHFRDVEKFITGQESKRLLLECVAAFVKQYYPEI